MPRVARALITFMDGSFLYVELSKKIDSKDELILCSKILGLPEGTPGDKPTIAASIMRASKAGKCLEMAIPANRINSVSIQEEYSGKEIGSDVKELWK